MNLQTLLLSKLANSNQPLSPIVPVQSPDPDTPHSRGPQYDSLDFLEVSPSHFTLPSLTNSRECLDEEEAMDALVNKMQLIFPSNMSYSGIKSMYKNACKTVNGQQLICMFCHIEPTQMHMYACIALLLSLTSLLIYSVLFAQMWSRTG